MRVDWAGEGYLEGVEGEDREARAALLDTMLEWGIDAEDLRQACAEDRLVLLPLEHALAPEGRRYTPREFAEELGQDVEFLARQRQALGLTVIDPDEASLTQEDLDAVRRTNALREAGVGDTQMLELARVMGQAMANVAAALTSITGESLLQAGDSERDVALRYAEAARELVPMAAPSLDYLFRAHMRAQLRQAVVDRRARELGRIDGGQQMAVCFADLTGFTRLGEEVTPDELGSLSGRLAEMASDAAAEPVRVVKMIGDAAMLVSPEPAPLLEAAFSLVDAAEAEGEKFPQVHAGIAYGEALGRSGDWFGRPVNLASRVSERAYPGSVLATEEVKDAVEDGYAWSFAGEQRLKGIKDDVKLFRARPA